MDLFLKKKLFCRFLLLYIFIVSNVTYAALSLRTPYKYKTSFGSCPSEIAGKLTIKISKIFSISRSLAEVKKTIISEKLAQRYFLSSYDIAYNPISNLLNIRLNCPEIISKVHLVKDGGIDGYDALLMSDGQVFDATFEILLNGNKKNKTEIPYFSVPVKYFNKSLSKDFAILLQLLDTRFRNTYLSEIILDDEKNLMFILSSGRKPTSVFLGKDNWNAKLSKMQKVFSYMHKNKKNPTIVNLTNLKKIVVKFNHNF